MILILSKPVDKDTDCVMDWLNFLKAPVLRINDEELMQGNVVFFYNISNEENSYFETLSQRVYLKDITVVWYRKFGFLSDYERRLDSVRDLVVFLHNEFKALRELILSLLDGKKWLFERNVKKSKIEVLSIAKDIGMNIPNTLVTTERHKLDAFLKSNNGLIITKPIAESTNIKLENTYASLSTAIVNTVNGLNKRFSPSFFQEYIDKEIELRIFYLMGKCYPMAIFSQNNPQTKVDFRDYDWETPNRFIPYVIPIELENNIDLLMKKLKLNTGSLDVIKASKDEKYYFLEVNPSGQFGMTAFPCNYPLHKHVAQKLISLNDEK
ncbi:grasp-with-spasm system ATP-grasp peptide maturase [Flavobacterium sp. LS1R49]|uniref:Grasp-with-spasm system ATP-grasp peptide maturase n=1 Tax=Flavobacterium shii TaxID=2987687 RepID=A0A9X2ZJT5_9FLAO|nr:grasp-with-spasm system ATP-grasp peptide maturase [Flavobacterium shii]MCV9930047.1 grasp-with-spasm system ATP-grasp peptide maturase [Flavobacterium shii]